MEKNIDALYLLHGTFVGDDPFQIIGLLEKTFPRLSEKMITKIKEKTKKGQDLVAGDVGNFVNTHIEIIHRLSQSSFPIHNFTWSSSNHHYARLEGMFKLIESLDSNQKNNDHVLLIGHSHAGQIFALLSQLLSNKEFEKIVFRLFKDQLDVSTIINSLKKIRTMTFDFVTFGTPARYKWELTKKMKLVHFINHRSNDLLGGSASGAVFTKSGDYIQQWGISGSDIISPIAHEKEINEKLNEILGEGSNIEFLKHNIGLRKRLHNQGHHFLVDYNDDSKYPNFFKTVFGHGVYTKLEHLKFHFHYINKVFYK